MKIPKLLLLLIVSLSIFMGGCWDSNEPERQFYTLGVGIDHKDGKYEVYLQLISFGNVAKSEQINQDLTQAEIGYASGENLYEIFFKLYESLDETLYWGHFTFLVIGEGALKGNELNTIMDIFTRFSDTRYTAWVYCTDENISDILQTVPALERAVTLTKMADPLNRYKQDSFIEPISIRKLVLDLNEPGNIVNIPYVKMSKDWKTEKGPDNITQITGVGVANRTNFKGFLRNEQAKGFQWFSKETKRVQVSFKTANEDLSVVLENLSIQIEPIVKEKEVKFDITIQATATLNNVFTQETNEQIQQGVEKEVKKEIEKTFKAGLESEADVYRLSEVLYRKNVKVWKVIHSDGQIPLTEDSLRKIKVNLTKIRAGRKEFTDTIKHD